MSCDAFKFIQSADIKEMDNVIYRMSWEAMHDVTIAGWPVSGSCDGWGI